MLDADRRRRRLEFLLNATKRERAVVGVRMEKEADAKAGCSSRMHGTGPPAGAMRPRHVISISFTAFPCSYTCVPQRLDDDAAQLLDSWSEAVCARTGQAHTHKYKY